jgi:hypothetical protein
MKVADATQIDAIKFSDGCLQSTHSVQHKTEVFEKSQKKLILNQWTSLKF